MEHIRELELNAHSCMHACTCDEPDLEGHSFRGTSSTGSHVVNNAVDDVAAGVSWHGGGYIDRSIAAPSLPPLRFSQCPGQ